MKYDLRSIVASAIMIGVPTIVVEGHDDISIYSKIAKDVNKEVQVISIDNIEQYTGGCYSVIKFIDDMEEIFEERKDSINHILGIIDRDARYYRNEIPTNRNGILVLKYYSIESHFVTKNNLKYLLNVITYANEQLVDDKCLDYIEKDLPELYKRLFYLSLEALKNACEQDYTGVIGYSDEKGRLLHDVEVNDLVLKKKKELDLFAEKLNIDIKDIKCIAKGKWLLYFYCVNAMEKISILRDACLQGLIITCQCCETDHNDKCLYKLKASYRPDTLIPLIENYIDREEVNYIQDRILKLA